MEILAEHALDSIVLGGIKAYMPCNLLQKFKPPSIRKLTNAVFLNQYFISLFFARMQVPYLAEEELEQVFRFV